MADETEEPTVAVDLAEAMGALISATLRITQEQAEARGLLQKLLVEREQLVELVTGLNLKVATLTALVDADHAVLTKLAGLPGRPKGDPLAN